MCECETAGTEGNKQSGNLIPIIDKVKDGAEKTGGQKPFQTAGPGRWGGIRAAGFVNAALAAGIRYGKGSTTTCLISFQLTKRVEERI